MSPFDVYRLYLSVRAHFVEDNYDIHKYGLIKPRRSTFLSRKDRWVFRRISEKYSSEEQIRELLVSNFVERHVQWSGELLDEDTTEIYNKWKGRQESITYIITRDLKYLLELAANHSFSWLFNVNEESAHTPVIDAYLHGEIGPETTVVLHRLFKFFDRVEGKKANRYLKQDELWGAVKKRIVKYDPFVTVDLNKIRTILAELLEEFYGKNDSNDNYEKHDKNEWQVKAF